MSEMRKILVSFSESLLSEVDVFVRRANLSRSELVRLAVSSYLAEQKRREIYEEMKIGYQMMGEINLGLAEEALAADSQQYMLYEKKLSGSE